MGKVLKKMILTLFSSQDASVKASVPQFLDNTGLSYLVGKLKKYFVKQETGKGLSKNDFTDTLKTKLENLPNFYSGTSEPSSSLGEDGDIYIKYEE